ncbi:MAG: DUF1772 domain-containing protein [Flavobacterium sp.]|nr:MAG: DUF1772 domain-containing protein [Flavobacterium sp.]
MDFSLENITSIVLVVLTGLSAGLCFTWTNSITPGIGRLNDLGFLQSFQQMNRTILNPLFFIVFFGPFFLNLLNIYLHRNQSNQIFWMLVVAGVLYILGVVVVTILGNVPLNEILDKTDLTRINALELKSLRDRFEGPWNRLHFIRTITATTSFILLLITYLQISKSINNL